MSLFVSGALGVLGAVVATLVDGRRAVLLASLALSLGLAPTVAAVGGGREAVLVIAVAALAGLVGMSAGLIGGRLPGVAGLDPLVPVHAAREHLFGPRSTRLAGAAAALPVASWVGFNIPAGTAAIVSGVLFPGLFAGLCAAVRLLTARTMEDLGVAASMAGIAAATCWIVVTSDASLNLVVFALAAPPVAAAAVGWLGGRHGRRSSSA